VGWNCTVTTSLLVDGLGMNIGAPMALERIALWWSRLEHIDHTPSSKAGVPKNLPSFKPLIRKLYPTDPSFRT